MNYVITDKTSLVEIKAKIDELPDRNNFNVECINDDNIPIRLKKLALVIEDDTLMLIEIIKRLGCNSEIKNVIGTNNKESFFEILSKIDTIPVFVSIDFQLYGEKENIFIYSSEIYLKVKKMFPTTPVIGYTNFESSGDPERNPETKQLIELYRSKGDSVFDKGSVKTTSAYNNIVRDKIRISKILAEKHELSKENILLKQEVKSLSTLCKSLPEDSGKPYLIGKSIAMRKVYETMRKIKNTLVRVLILGGRGAGKELIAKAIQEDSHISSMDFRIVNCAELFEDDDKSLSKLFGHVKGAFTGATSDRDGEIALANNGTLFLDEVGELPRKAQELLLRFLQEGTYFPLGSDKVKQANVRIIAATNLPMAELEKKFRKDFLDRINEYPIILPPLNERREDIPLLIDHFISNNEFKKKTFGNSHITFEIKDDAKEYVSNLDFEGNIRELQNFIRQAMIDSMDNNGVINKEIILNLVKKDSARIHLNVDLEDAIEFLNQIESIIKEYLIDKEKVVSSDILPYFLSSKDKKTNINRVYFASKELAPRKNSIEKLYELYPDRWLIIKDKKLNLISKSKN